MGGEYIKGLCSSHPPIEERDGEDPLFRQRKAVHICDIQQKFYCHFHVSETSSFRGLAVVAPPKQDPLKKFEKRKHCCLSSIEMQNPKKEF